MDKFSRTTPACLFLIAVLAAGCAPGSGAPDSTLPPAATVAAPEDAVATVFVTGGSVTGTVLWGETPIGGAQVELRHVDWRVTGDETAVASATAGPDGAYAITDVPAGEWSVVALWPGGEVSAGGTPVVTVTEGQEVGNTLVRLERAMTLLEPDLGQPGGTTPTVRWQPVDGVDAYRVLFIDRGTTEAVVQELVDGDSLTVAEGRLQPSRGYTLVISGMGAGSDIPLASFTGDYVVTGVPPASPTDNY